MKNLFLYFALWITTVSLMPSISISEWLQTNGPYGGYISTLAVSGTNLFAGTSDRGVFRTTDDGTSWTVVNTGLTNTYINDLIVSDTNLFAGTNGGGVWRRPLSEMITGVSDQAYYLPAQFILGQNYPNPFNPTTNISFSVGTYNYTSLRIYDLLGREVATLVSERLPAGNYTRQWNASGMPSGVYFYRLQAGLAVKTKKLVIIK